MSRKEKRKELKKQKRKQVRWEAALLSLQEEGEKNEEAVIRQQREEEEALAKERAEHEEQERLWLLREEKAHKDWLRKQEEEAERKRKNEERSRKGEAEEDLEEGWEYVEDGPAEIIWQGNEIIVKKPRKKVRKDTNSAIQAIEEKDRPTSNPLPPQSTAFSSYQVNVQDVADQATNFGTEQDKRNCPFYIKTGVCRFGVRCSRLHPVFNEACTLLIRSMYTGAGLALEHVESLEVCDGIEDSHKLTSRRDGQMLRWQDEKETAYTDEEVVQEYEEFYDDVHSEFIQFGELVNFKVCRNGSPHLRGNVYVHYVSQESTLAAYNHMNGRFYAKKQISCEFVGVMKWKLAICGEFMRTHYKTCSHGSACNFMHCFENPRREYQWADLDRSPPRFWQRKMAAFFGHAHISDEDFDEKQEKARTYRESAHNNDRGRHRGDRELLYDDGRRRDRHMRESVRDDDRRRGRDDRERQCYEDEMKDRSRRESKYDDRLRERHSKENSHDSRRREDVSDSTYDVNSARDMSTSRSMYGDDQGYNIDERWPMFDDNRKTDDTEEVYERDQRRDRRHTETTYDDDDDDFNDNRHPGRHSSTSDHVSLHRHSRSHSRSHSHSHRNRSRRSRSPDSHRTRMSRSRDRSTSQRAHSQDGYVTDEEHEDRYSRATRDSEGKKDRASKDGKRHKNSVSRSGDSLHDNQAAKRDDDIRGHRSRHSSRDRWRYSESDQQRTKPLESDDTRSGHSKDLDGTVAGLVSGEDASGSRMNLETQSDLKTGIDVGNPNQETNSTNSNTMTGLSLALSTDDVQKSTTQWQSWRKAKSKKPGLKDNPMRVII